MQLLPKRLSRCALDGEPLNQGSEYVSFLDDEGRRKDYCAQCWERLEKPTDGCTWRGRVPLRRERALRPDERALQLFRETDNRSKRFVLALYLQRKRQLVQRTQTLFELPVTGEIFDVERITLTFNEGEQIIKEIDDALAMPGQSKESAVH